MYKSVVLGLFATALAFAIPETAVAKDKGKPEHAQGGKGNKIKSSKPGKGPKAMPPGQIKRYTRGAKLPDDVDWEDVGDLSKWNLSPPGKGNKYVRVDDEILEIVEDTQTVIDAVGMADNLLK